MEYILNTEHDGHQGCDIIVTVRTGGRLRVSHVMMTRRGAPQPGTGIDQQRDGGSCDQHQQDVRHSGPDPGEERVSGLGPGEGDQGVQGAGLLHHSVAPVNSGRSRGQSRSKLLEKYNRFEGGRLYLTREY